MMRLADVDATLDAGRMLAGVLRPGDVITVAGGLGSGKTTLARGILAGLGFEGDVPSPSFP
ncbi:tRNA (adenosine(37)-N6)-threonylcarbamoyltransferase complex ATPase subunit type 1 TsaE, partial [Escherichia coli]|uniref:tRNA (adenosine(37)-N6)-threonylcarbamoyltransferase complex ATPase subunit type 1 TsaE n=1 Tax=Escherichia coli TaxID=562 RepID=UPI003CF1C79F